MEPIRLFIGRPCGWSLEHPDVGNWCVKTVGDLVAAGVIEAFRAMVEPRPRIAMARNEIVKEFLRGPCNWLLMIDPDMRPDITGEGFLLTSLRLLQATGGGVVGAPACAGPPGYSVNVFWMAQDDAGIRHVSHQEAAEMRGIELVPAVGTGLMLASRNVFERIEPPWFSDEMLDKEETKLRMSQDVAFCMRARQHGVPVFVNWSCWAGHHKQHLVGRPDGYQLPISL